MKDLNTLIKTWDLSADLHSFENPATERELQRAEKVLNIRLPSALRELYLYSNGMYLLEGNLSIYPLFGSGNDLGLTNASAKLREWNWPIPMEVLVFGNNGSDDLFGLWYTGTQSHIFRCPVLQIGEIFLGPNMAVAGTDLVPFLYGWSLYYLILLEAETISLDILEAPNFLRFSAKDLADEYFVEIRRWADPTLPDPDPDPYSRGYDQDGLRKLFAAFPG